ncbi:MAG TPA: glycosyltransferase family 4 protein [Chloroflexia bacterium]|nr:glycosyltransferase family 4 protein [Chloroflexia bacterium]
MTDVFPPRSGGSGWSTFYLGKALAERGHEVRVLRPGYGENVPRPALRADTYEGMSVEWVLVPPAPRWAQKVGLAKAWQERVARRLLAKRACKLAMMGKADVLHGQHKVSAGAASIAARGARARGAKVVSVATVRDYWPLCPVSTRLFTVPSVGTFECRECHKFWHYAGALVFPLRLGPMQKLYWPSLFFSGLRKALKVRAVHLAFALPRWLATLANSRLLAQCDAVVGVSRYVRDELAMSGRVEGTKLHSIPNLVHLPSVERALSGAWPLSDVSQQDDFALFVGKLDENKGADMLPVTNLHMPIVVVGDGPEKKYLEIEGEGSSIDFRFYDWLDNDAILRLMRAARVLLFPSAWQEPLSRVLLEGCAAGAAIVALNTGGTADIITHGESGWLAVDEAGFAEGARLVAKDDALNRHLREGARKRAETGFAAPVVSAQIEALYASLLDDVGGRAS